MAWEVSRLLVNHHETSNPKHIADGAQEVWILADAGECLRAHGATFRTLAHLKTLFEADAKN